MLNNYTERRTTSALLRLDSSSPSTKVPSRTEGFWACGKNKEKLQRLSPTLFINVSKENDISIIQSGFVTFDAETMYFITLQKEISRIQQDLTSTIEEADIHIIAYVNQVVKEKSSNTVILLNNRDVVVLVLYYIEKIV